MSAPRDLTATILRVLQRTADVQGNVTMLRAAKNLGRRAVLWEEREDFCELIALRLSSSVRSAPDTLFGGVA